MPETREHRIKRLRWELDHFEHWPEPKHLRGLGDDAVYQIPVPDKMPIDRVDLRWLIEDAEKN